MKLELRHHGRTLALLALVALLALAAAIGVAGGAGAASSSSGGQGPAFVPVQSESQPERPAPEGSQRERDCPEGERGGQAPESGSGTQGTALPEV